MALKTHLKTRGRGLEKPRRGGRSGVPRICEWDECESCLSRAGLLSGVGLLVCCGQSVIPRKLRAGPEVFRGMKKGNGAHDSLQDVGTVQFLDISGLLPPVDALQL